MKAEYAYGLHAVESLLQQQPQNVLELWLLDSRSDPAIERIRALAGRQGLPLHGAERSQLDRLCNQGVHQGVVARIRAVAPAGENELLSLIEQLQDPAFLLILDGVQDPHNLGACIRSAEAAGVQAVVFPRDRAAGLTPVARKVAAGAAERLPLFQVTNLARIIEMVKKAGIWVVGAAGDSDVSLFQLDLKGPLAMVMGAEGEGLRPRIRGLCDHLAAIPMSAGAESLNVSVATGVMLFEARRQRQLA